MAENKPTALFGNARETALLGFLLKLVSVFLLSFALRYWGQMIGITDPATNFLTLDQHWKVAVATLAVLHPVAALGLWGNMSWGVVVWLLVIVCELTMHVLLPELFGPAPRLVVFHAISFLSFLIASGLVVIKAQSKPQLEI